MFGAVKFHLLDLEPMFLGVTIPLWTQLRRQNQMGKNKTCSDEAHGTNGKQLGTQITTHTQRNIHELAWPSLHS